MTNKQKNRAIFLDRDGVINIDKGYVYRIQDFEFVPGVIDFLKSIPLEYKKIIITNQSGIRRGYYSEEDYQRVTNHMLNELKKQKITIDAVYHCPHKSDDNCECRKPKIGMLKRAEKDFSLNLRECIFVGDKESDAECGRKAGCKVILVKMNEAIKLRL